ncbi:MAG: tRNA (N(6)-L-threonylcarbamoyladenosine(37)-C(2))-methylthiotransferase MtaB [Acidobacteria bacterium]|nr:MAG: tRNA (N(6)-L-threonylcarbamoyladenosine(37)-C(2))-methylthiotransferase MtaB [Acidobacteriota bacterium]
MSSFFVHTFGCRCNQSDSAAIREQLARSRRSESGAAEDADLVVVNTCTVTHRTDRQVRQAVRRLRRVNPGARLVVTGCYAERDPSALASIPGVDLVVGNADKERIAELVDQAEAAGSETRGRIIRSPLDAARDYLVAPMSRTGGRTRPFVKIQDGCDAACSYCVIPAVRGPGRGARPEEILGEVRRLVEQGYQEIVLTGVHLGTYGTRFARPTSLAALLEDILATPRLGRLRLSSIEPMRFSREIVELAAGHEAFARHFHIPMQSGSDRILRRMRRPYTAARFLELLGTIAERIPGVCLGTDAIVGFPGETDSDFERTCELVESSPLGYAHVFPFSAREGTDAWSLPHPVPLAVVRERARLLREITRRKNLAFRQRFAGQELPALTLAPEEEMGESVVLTDNYIQARTPGFDLPPNRLVRARIERVEHEATLATITSPE